LHYPPFAIYDWGHEIAIPIDPATGQITGVRQHGPFIINKIMDRLSPLFYQALATNENLPSLIIRILMTDGNGNVTPTFTVELTNARVIKVTKNINPDKVGLVEVLYLSYQKIAWTDVISGVATEVYWGSPP
jgi:type VI secretion system secreted protein Hcp